jgi:hypothetical protein
MTAAVAIHDDTTGVDPATDIAAVITNPILSGNWDGATVFPSDAQGHAIEDAFTATKAALAQIIAKVNTDSAAVTAIAANFKEFTARQAENRAAIVSLTNAEASLAAQVNGLINGAKGTADEVNARVLKVEENVDTIGYIRWAVPRDYDEKLDILTLRVLASQVAQVADAHVHLDAEMYVKKAGVALSADHNPTASTVLLSTTEQWVEITLSGHGLKRDDVVAIELITNGGNNTDGDEVLIHDLELVYRSTLVSYEKQTSAGVSLR